MKVFSTDLRRNQLIKLLLGLGVLGYMIRIVLGLTNQTEVLGVGFGGLTEFFVITMIFSVTLLLWDIRDKIITR
ncbi:MAG: hypothetical protein Q7S57_01945 [bacterium]|nr:hypothetical protein [bacterium]